MVLPRATAAALLPGFLPDSCPGSALPASSAMHPAKTARLNENFLTFPPFRLIQHSSILHVPTANFHPPPVKKDSLRLCTASTFVPLTSVRISVHNGPMSQETLTRAWEVLQDAYQAQMEGDYDRAAELYQSSLELHPTAEAHTFLGWTYHFQGRLLEAISECKRAIELDPDFGNPYNDIGAYLIELGQFDEAIPWLQQAVEARRYNRATFPTTTWAVHISARKCTARPCAASRKRSTSSLAIPSRA